MAKKIDRNVSVKEISKPVCVDLTTLRPDYAVTSRKQSLPEAFLWQQWKIEKQTVNIELFNSDAAYILPEVTSISVSDLFFCKNSNSDDLDHAARTFVSRLRGMFRNNTLIWLVPDSLNDFELDITRRNLNACFPNAEPLPRSIAAAFEQVDRTRIKDNYPIVVVDTIGGKTCITKLIAMFDPELKARIPETGGFYWERQPPVVIAGTDSDSTQQKAYDLSTLNEKGEWSDPVHPAKLPFIDVAMLKRDSRIGSFAFAIFLTESPVSGGARLYNLQQQAGDIPLWRDQIPELSIKVRKDGFFQRFYLISRGTNVRPIRGRPVSITVKENFILSAGQDDYQFPLFLGEGADNLGFSARLDSPAFPLRQSAICQLDLSFEYGADDPYKLIFRPLDNAFPPVKATWQRTEEVIITDAPAPEYPLPLVWADLQSWIDVQGNQIDLLRWLNDSLFRLYELIPTYSAITISSRWSQKKDPNNETYWFSFATTQRGERCYCNTKRFTVVIDFDPNDRFPCGTELYCRTQYTKEGGISAVDISIENNQSLSYEAKQRMISFKERSLQNRMSLIWGDARSLKNLACSMEFREKFIELSAMLLSTLPSDIINRKIFPLLACTHKDAPDLCIQWITEQVKNGVIYDTRAIGFSLGDVSEPWQEYILSELIKRPNNDTVRIFAYAIWRDQHFVEKFDLVQLKLILNSLKMILGQIRPCPPRKNPKDKLTIRNWARNTTEPLELLLGLLRTRNASDPDIRMLLQPRQKITVELAKLVEHVTELVAQSNVSLFSRVQLSIEKPEGDRTPDLLYALRLYLTGDDGANAIHITTISDREDE